MIDTVRLARKVWGEQAILPFEDLERFATLYREAVVQELVANQVMPAKEFEGELWVRAVDSHALNAGAVLRERERCAKAGKDALAYRPDLGAIVDVAIRSGA